MILARRSFLSGTAAVAAIPSPLAPTDYNPPSIIFPDLPRNWKYTVHVIMPNGSTRAFTSADDFTSYILEPGYSYVVSVDTVA